MSIMRPITPVGAVNPLTASSAAIAANQVRATQAQAQVTGAASNYSAQECQQMQQMHQPGAQQLKLIGNQTTVPTLEALEAVPDLKGGHGEDEDPANTGRGVRGRGKRNKRRPPVSPF